MSKTQEKRAQRKSEQQAFIAARREQQLAMLEHAYLVGLKIYEDRKSEMSEEDIELIEKLKAEQLALLEKLRNEANPNPEA
jgi:hypothetical protein